MMTRIRYAIITLYHFGVHMFIYIYIPELARLFRCDLRHQKGTFLILRSLKLYYSVGNPALAGQLGRSDVARPRKIL